MVKPSKTRPNITKKIVDWDLNRDANHSYFCGLLPIFKANFHITISDVIPANNNFTLVLGKIKEVTSTCTSIWRKLLLGRSLYPITCIKVRFRLVCILFIGKRLP